jgi:hypothetical protein
MVGLLLLLVSASPPSTTQRSSVIKAVVSVNYSKPGASPILGLALFEDGSLGRAWAADDVHCSLVPKSDVDAIQTLLDSPEFKSAFERGVAREKAQVAPYRDAILVIRVSHRTAVEPALSASKPIRDLVDLLNGIYRRSCAGTTVPEIPLDHGKNR